MPKFPITPAKQAELDAAMLRLGINESDLQESFVRSQGAGGQNVNKVATCVVLRHLPSGLEVRCQRERTQGLNRYLARLQLLKRIEAQRLKHEADKLQRIAKIKRQKRPRSQKQKAISIEFKRKRTQKLQQRKPPRAKELE
jgi:protein subunit release factor B